MHLSARRRRVPSPRLQQGLVSLLIAALGASTSAAQYTINTADIPGGSANNSSTENVDFGDVDLDGDWDMLFADGGDSGNDQNRLWINQGGAQGGSLGVFTDQTASRLPTVSDDSRDVEFLDFDNDGDLDVYTSNTSQQQNQSNRWLTNQGLAQGGTLGVYADETLTRWIGLGVTGQSSVAGSLLLPPTGALPGGFVDWSCDCDFGDLDNDGDLDLFHSTYGSSFGGTVPSRIFLNDGDGFFAEFNPSGFKLLGATMPTGAPAIWCEGTFQANTTNTTGAQADICTNTLDIDLGDIDGDLDLDILHGDRDSLTRFFHNRLEENGGSTLGFRDVSNFVYPGTNWAVGGGNYEQELGDIDGDGDLDLYGLNWESAAGSDRFFRNNNGVFGNQTVLAGSTSDDNEGDFVDYDNDGDLDLYVANFSGADKLYRNNDTGSGSVSFTKQSSTGLATGTGLDADAGDLDGDGDYDIMVARDNGTANQYLENTTGTPDTTAPSLYRLEDTADMPASPAPNVVRVQVYDNAPYYITWYNSGALELSVDGVRLPDVPMRSSAGQIFRGELPGNLIGAVSYRARSADQYGNTGFSATRSYVGGGTAGSAFGSDTPGSLGVPTHDALSLPFPNTTLYYHVGNLPPATFTFLALSVGQQTPSLDLSNGLVLNVKLPILLFVPLLSDANGDAVHPLFIPSGLSGLTLTTQAFTLDGVAGNVYSSSRGLGVALP